MLMNFPWTLVSAEEEDVEDDTVTMMPDEVEEKEERRAEKKKTGTFTDPEYRAVVVGRQNPTTPNTCTTSIVKTATVRVRVVRDVY
jgi:hypothetical protein